MDEDDNDNRMSYTNPILELEKQKILLAKEYEAEREAFQQQTEAHGIGRKLRRGDAWWPLTTGKAYYNSLNQYCIEVHRQHDDDTDHNFEYGRPICFFRLNSTITDGKIVAAAGEKPRYMPFTATVSYVEGDRMVVALNSESHAAELLQAAGLGVQLSFDETSYRTMCDALERVTRSRGNRLAYLRDLFYTDMPAQRYTFGDIRRHTPAVAKPYSGTCGERSAAGKGCSHRTRPSWNGQDNDSRRGYLRVSAEGKPGHGVRTEQYGCGLD